MAAFYDVLRSRWRAAPREPAVWAYALASVFAASIAYDLLRMPVQVYDSLGEILAAQSSPGAWQSFWRAAASEAYFRPLRIAQIKALFDLADGNYWLVYRGWHALLLSGAFFLFTRAMRVRTAVDLGAAAFALTVLMGMHTFRGTVQEAFPINHFLEVVVAALVALNLAQSRGGWWVDGLAACTFAAAALTLESGLLVWVVAVSAWAAGMRGISRRGLTAMTALLGLYLYLRFVHLEVGTPALSERSSGFLLTVLDPPDIEARFGDNPIVFYAYNVAASLLSVLFSEPQSGAFVGVRSWLAGAVPMRVIVAAVSSVPTTLLVAWACARSVRGWRAPDHTAQLLVVFVSVLCANAILSFAYTKDEVMSIAGVFYALAAFAAVRLALEHPPSSRAVASAALAVVLFVAGSGWAVRSAGIHHILKLQATRHRFDWAVRPTLQSPVGGGLTDARSAALVQRLQDAAIDMRLPSPRSHPGWTEDLWGD